MRFSRSALLASSNLFASNFAILALCVLILSTLGLAAAPDRIINPVVARQSIQLSAGVPLKARPQYDQGAVDPSLKLSYMTLLTVPSASQQKALNKLLVDQQNPQSPLYHQWLTPEQYADRFGLSNNDIKKLTAWLQSQGFTVNNVARGRNWIAFTGTAAQVENAFQTKLHNFNVEGEMHYANIAPPSIPAALSGVVAAIRGLHNFRAKSNLQRRKPDYSFPTGGNNFALFVAPGDIETIYDLTPLYAAGIDGTGQKLAVMGRTDVYLADLNDFRSGFGLTTINCTPDSNGLITTACNTSNFQYVLNGPDPGVDGDGDDLPEADLDLELSGATARNAQIIYVNSGGTANDVFDAFYFSIDNDLAPVISLSYGLCELGDIGFFDSDEAELQKANLEGITFMNSSGDAGSAECDGVPPGFPNSQPPFAGAVFGQAVAYPASSPEVTGVGGTMIPNGEYNATYWGTTNGANGGSALSYIPENPWNDDTEIGFFCTALQPSNPACDPSPGVKIVGAQTAQEDFWISQTGGGPSNCEKINQNTGACTSGFAQPSWQTVTIAGQPAARFTPDISLLASANFPGYVWCTPVFELTSGTSTASSCASGINNSINTYNSIIGGTSASAPVFAGIVTLLNQYLVGSSSAGLGNINPMLYALAKSSPTAFHPVTAGLNAPGSNIVYCQPGDPTGQPAALVCPSSGPNTGIVGYLSANADVGGTGYNLVTGLGSIDANNLFVAWAAARTASSTLIQAQPTQATLGQSVTLTATVSPSTAVGKVSFFNNGSTTALGTGTISGGVATFSTTSLPVGMDKITASFPGDGYNAPSITVTAAVVNVLAPDFMLTNTGSASATVKAGVPGTGYAFTVAPLAPATSFGAPVTLGCSFAPADPTLTTSSCAFTGSGIQNNVIQATNGSTPVTLVITTTGPNMAAGPSQQQKRADNRPPWLPFALPIAGFVLVGLAGRNISRQSAIVGLCVSLILLGLLVACGGGSSSPPPPVGVSVGQGSPSSVFPNNTGWPLQTAQFTATVTNSTNTAVTWAVTGGSANGTISASGLYTAPMVAAGLPSAVTITATSAADPTKSGSAQETLKAATVPGTYSVTVTATDTTTPPVTHMLPIITLTVQ